MIYYFDLYEERGTGLVEPEFGKELCWVWYNLTVLAEGTTRDGAD